MTKMSRLTLEMKKKEMERPRRIFIRTFGCQMNRLDSELLLNVFSENGYLLAGSMEDADVILFNTCSVRQHAEDKALSHVGTTRTLKRRRPDLVVGVVGCMAQRLGQRLFDIAPHVDIVCGTRNLKLLPDVVEAVRAGAGRQCFVEFSDEGQKGVRPTHRKLIRESPTAMVAVMRGCSNFCSYCIVPYVRGPEVSRPMAEIEDEVGRLVDQGCCEITLLGQNVNVYGHDLSPPLDLADLLERLDAIPGLERLRFVTSHPAFVTRKLFEAMRDLPTVCEHLHAPAQSGSDRILGLMNRKYTSSQYLDMIEMGREIVPDLAYASDFIVGFPTETRVDFNETVRLCERVRYQNSFVFKYSPREGTKAAELPDDVPMEEKKTRNQELLRLQERISRQQQNALVGKVVEILVEGASKSDASKLMGRTRDHRIVIVQGQATMVGRLVNVQIENATPLTLFGRVVEQSCKRGENEGARKL